MGWVGKSVFIGVFGIVGEGALWGGWSWVGLIPIAPGLVEGSGEGGVGGGGYEMSVVSTGGRQPAVLCSFQITNGAHPKAEGKKI